MKSNMTGAEWTREIRRRERLDNARMAKKAKPGDIAGYKRRPRKGEILCHNTVVHTRDMESGLNGFRYFVVRTPAEGWEVCPCGWRPDLGVHYAVAEHVNWWRGLRKRLGSQRAVDRHIFKQVTSDWPPALRRWLKNGGKGASP